LLERQRVSVIWARCSAPTATSGPVVSGADMLRHVHSLLVAEGYRVGNAAVQ